MYVKPAQRLLRYCTLASKTNGPINKPHTTGVIAKVGRLYHQQKHNAVHLLASLEQHLHSTPASQTTAYNINQKGIRSQILNKLHTHICTSV